MKPERDHETIVPGITVTPSGQATVDPRLTNVLFDLAIDFEERTNLPVDVEHVIAAIVLAARRGTIDQGKPLSSDDQALAESLIAEIQKVFADYGGQVGRDD